MSVREYVGARYVPAFATPIDWNSANTYEPLTIVLHEGNSYTSRQAVPAGIQITNTAYWAQTGNYNAQIEQYRQDVAALASKFPVSVLDGGTGGTDAAAARTNLDAAQADGATNTLYDAEQAITANAAAITSLQNSASWLLSCNQLHSLILETSFTNGMSYELYNNRKLSDYRMLFFYCNDGNILRGSAVLVRDVFTRIGQWYIDIFHGGMNSLGMPSSMNRIILEYVDDTHVKVWISGSGMLTRGSLIGFY